MMPSLPTETIIGLIITVIMGLSFGSFATMAVYRLPRNMPWIGDKPRCLMCKAELTILDYFSILSYFIHHGTCRHCGGKYEENIGYFFTELGITAGLMVAYLLFGFGDQFVFATGLVVAGVVLAVIDAEHQKIPAKILLTLLLTGAIYRTFMDQTFYGVIYGGFFGAIVGVSLRYLYFLYQKTPRIGFDFMTWQHDDRFVGPGMDYVKLLAIISIWLPVGPFISYLSIIVPISILWYGIHKPSLRLGAIMVLGLMIAFSINPSVL